MNNIYIIYNYIKEIIIKFNNKDISKEIIVLLIIYVGFIQYKIMKITKYKVDIMILTILLTIIIFNPLYLPFIHNYFKIS